MRKSLLTIALVLLACGSAAARSLSPSEALARALNSENTSGALRAPSRAVPVMTVGTEEQPAVYVFDQGTQGYLMVSADDVAAPVLAYSDSGTFDPDNMPESLRWWLGEYKTQIEAASKASAESYEKASRAERKPIEPLIKTFWNQGEPYNNKCPELLGQKTVTGCVATAMAQVMDFHKWPESFNAFFNYEWDATGTSLAWSERNVPFNWDEMLDVYKKPHYTSAQADAVATLMKACGYSVEMNYNIASRGGSGAVSAYIPSALTKYFKYDKGVYNANREFYSLTEWENLIYDNLKDSIPVIYSGSNSSAGHCFVCDGYSSDGYFHFNWGWGGVSNGYYLLSALNPDIQGIGGSTSGYNATQEVVLGIKKPGNNSVMKKIVLCYGDFSASASQKGGKTYITLNGPFFNLSNGTISGRLGFRLVGSDGTIRDFTETGSEYFESGTGRSFFTLSGDFPTGSWKLYPIFKYSNTETAIIPCKADQAGYLDYQKTGNKVTITTPESGRYNITDLEIKTPMYDGSKYLATGKAQWSGSNSVSTAVYGVLMTGLDASTIQTFGETMQLEFLPDNSPLDFDYVSSGWYWIFNDEDGRKVLKNVSIAPGDYYFAMAVEKGYNLDGFKLISTPIRVKIQPQQLNTKVSIKSLTVTDAEAVNPENFIASVEVECNSGYFFDNLIVAVFKRPSLDNIGQFNTDIIPIEANQKATLTAKGVLNGVKANDRCIVEVFNRNGQSLKIEQEITIGDSSGIGDVIADGSKAATASPNPATDHSVITATDEIIRVDLISLSGAVLSVPTDINGQSARIDVSAIPAGLYMARIVTATGIETVKIIKK